MKLNGRITIFGEYLIKEQLSSCLCIKSKLFLSNEEKHVRYNHKTYEYSNDSTVHMLKAYGADPILRIYGNLPLGYGLSSSTILSILHLNSTSNKSTIEAIDKKINGFSPSDLDYTSITIAVS